MRIISLCADGIHQAAERSLFAWLASQDADIICLQNLKAQEHELEWQPQFELEGYFAYFFGDAEPNSNGVAIYTREMPKALMYGFGFASGEDMKGRYLQADFAHTSVGSLLAPVGITGTPSQDVKRQFFNDLQAHLEKISHKRRSYIICGNWNIAHNDNDLENPDDYREESGFLTSERSWLNALFGDLGYCDAFRRGNSDTDEFSWWPSGKIGQGDGRRVDYQVVSNELAPLVEYAIMYKAKEFSAHTPVIVDYDIEEL
ncbi:endonuclease/exonuclease/phosphatase family protein [bacterium SCSIO 12696]|nr:endonuclease/exonuclease/phosphatase family protein [bacterium SCSIO 12696]